MKYLFIFLFLTWPVLLYAQNKQKVGRTHKNVDQPALFEHPSYEKAKHFYEQYLIEKTLVPVIDTLTEVQVDFTVDEKGTVSKTRTSKNIECSFQAQLNYVMSSMSPWRDSLGNCIPAKTRYLINLKFYPPGGTLPDEEAVFGGSGDMPLFQGEAAEESFRKWIYENLRIPKAVTERGITGRVFVEFTVEEDGSVTSVKTMRDVSPELDAEAVRVISSSPRWTPGRKCGNPTRVKYTFPIIFGQLPATTQPRYNIR